MSAVKRSYEDIAQSEEDKRSYRGLELHNGLKVSGGVGLDHYYTTTYHWGSQLPFPVSSPSKDLLPFFEGNFF